MQTKPSKQKFSLLSISMQTLVVALGFFFFGYNIVLLNTLEKPLVQLFKWNKSQTTSYISIGNSVFYIGNIIGSLIVGRLSDKFTKRKVIMIGCLLVIMFQSLMVIRNITLIIILRLLTGIPSSIFVSTIPSYIAEIVPKNKIGVFAGIYHIFLPLGVTFGLYLGIFLPEAQLIDGAGLEQNMWRIIIIIPVMTTIILLLSLIFIFNNDTPFEMVKTEQEHSMIIKQLSRAYNVNDHELIDFEYKSLQTRCKTQTKSITFRDLISQKYRRQFILAIIIHLSFQIGSIGIFSSYSINMLMKSESMSKSHAIQWSTLFGLAEVLGNAVGILVIDPFGKKTIMMISYGLQTLAMIMMSVLYWVAVKNSQQILILFYFFIFGVGFDTIIWIYTSDLVTGLGFGLCIFVNSLSSSIIVLITPFLFESSLSYAGTIIIFGLLSLLCWIILMIWLPETKGLNFQQVFEMFQKKYQQVEVQDTQNIEMKQDHKIDTVTYQIHHTDYQSIPNND